MSWEIRYIWLILFVMISTSCKSQDTVKITDNHYLTHLPDSNVRINSISLFAYSAKHSEGYFAPTDTTTIYGVLIPMTDWIWYLKEDTCRNMSVALCKNMGFLDTIDSINSNLLVKKVSLNAGYIESGHLAYSPVDSENMYMCGIEVYFDYQHSVLEDLPDTFFVAQARYFILSPGSTDYLHLACPYSYIYTANLEGHHVWYNFDSYGNPHLIEGQNTWGSLDIIPIVKLRSDPPKGFRMLSREGNSATVAWRGSYDVVSYQLSIGLFGENPDDGEIVTLPADSAEYNTTLTYTFDNLDYGVRHAVWIRKSCR